jgi:hypothetical protein
MFGVRDLVARSSSWVGSVIFVIVSRPVIPRDF